MAKAKTSRLITPRDEDYSRWYTDLVTQGKLADYSPVKGCMVIRPHGYALWENMQRVLDRMIDEELLGQRGLDLGLVRADRRVRADLVSAVIAKRYMAFIVPDGYFAKPEARPEPVAERR